MKDLNCNTIGLDWTMDIESSIKLFDNTKTLQGNLDPCVLYGDFNLIEKKTKEMLDKFVNTRHIANLGHGVYPDTDPEKVKCFINSIKSN
jgi:uroporphyrinogen decarboxylase